MKTKDTPKQYVIYSRKSKFTGKGESIGRSDKAGGANAQPVMTWLASAFARII